MYEYKIIASFWEDAERHLKQLSGDHWELVTAFKENIQFTFILRREIDP